MNIDHQTMLANQNLSRACQDDTLVKEDSKESEKSVLSFRKPKEDLRVQAKAPPSQKSINQEQRSSREEVERAASEGTVLGISAMRYSRKGHAEGKQSRLNKK